MVDNSYAVLEDVRIIFRNFAGEERQYNRKGDRNFTVILPEDIGERMAKDGWNIKRLKPRDPEELGDLSLKVKVNFEGRPPTVALITSRGKTNLDEESCELMDYAEFERVDLTISPYNWKVNGKTGTTAYLRSIFGFIREDELEVKYADIPEINSQPVHAELERVREMPALPAGEDDIPEIEVIEG